MVAFSAQLRRPATVGCRENWADGKMKNAKDWSHVTVLAEMRLKPDGRWECGLAAGGG